MSEQAIAIQTEKRLPLDHFLGDVIETQGFPGADLTTILTEARILTAMGTPGFSRERGQIMLTEEGRQQLGDRLEGFASPEAVREDGPRMRVNRESDYDLIPKASIEVESIPWEVELVATSTPRQRPKSSRFFEINLPIPQSSPTLEEQLVKTNETQGQGIKVMFPEKKGPAVAVSPFSKNGEKVQIRENSDDAVRFWPFPPMHLGAFLHHCLQGELVAESSPLPMQDYLLHLDTLGDHYAGQGGGDDSSSQRLAEVGLARLMLEKTKRLSQEVVHEINQQLPKGFSPTAWVKEVPFVLPNRQSEVIARALGNEDLRDFVATVFGDEDLFKLGERAICNPDFRLAIPDGRHSQEMNLQDIYEKAREAEGIENPSYLHQVCDFLAAISSYYLFDNQRIQPEDMVIPDQFKKLILCASARCDLIGLLARNGKGQQKREELIAEFIDRARGRLFGWRPLHDFVHTPSEAIDVQKRLVEAVKNEEVAVWLGEIKTCLTEQGEIDFYGDLAHTVFAVLQSLTRGLNHPASLSDRLSNLLSFGSKGQKTGGVRPDLLIKLMTASPEETEEVLMGLRPMMRMLEPPNAVFGLGINWPVVDSGVSESKPLYGLRPDRVAGVDPEWNISVLDPRRLRRLVAEKGEDFLQRLM